MIGRLRHLDDTADLDDGLALGDQLLGGLALADDLFRRVPGAFHGRVPGPVWLDEVSHSPWTDSQGQSHMYQAGIRMLFLMRASGMALRKLIRTRSVAFLRFAAQREDEHAYRSRWRGPGARGSLTYFESDCRGVRFPQW